MHAWYKKNKSANCGGAPRGAPTAAELAAGGPLRVSAKPSPRRLASSSSRAFWPRPCAAMQTRAPCRCHRPRPPRTPKALPRQRRAQH
eukprot:6546376-Pyramimonas_sp.AAC.1